MCEFPDEWKLGKVIPLPKSGNLNQVGNWRPVCILSLFSKLCEKIIHRQMMDHLLYHDHLSTQQYGFIPGRGTKDAIFGLTNDLYEAMNKGLPSAVVFFDLRKAFDTVDHTILMSKLKNMGLSPNALSWIKSYLSARRQVTEANAKRSSELPVPCGVPQGSVLGPLLFLAYINDVELEIKNVNAYMFADDLALVSSGHDVRRVTRLLQDDTNAVSAWCALNRLTVNTDKTKVLWVYPRRNPPDITEASITLNQRVLEVVTTFNYLGVTLDRHLTLGPQCTKLIGIIKSKLHLLKRTRLYTNQETTLLLYKQMVLPILEYCPLVIDGGPVGAVRKLQTLQNDCLRICKSIADPRDIRVHDLHLECKLDELAYRRNKQILSYMYSISRKADEVLVPTRVLRANLKVQLKPKRVIKDIYTMSPYFRGSRLWDRLQPEQQRSPNTLAFMNSLCKDDCRPLDPVVV